MLRGMKRSVSWLAFAAVFGVVALTSNVGRAAFVLKLSDGANNVVVNGSNGFVSYVGMVGSSMMNVSAGISMPLLGSATQPHMHLTSFAAFTGGELTISLTQTGFSNTPMGLDPAAFLSSIGGIGGTNGSISFETWVTDETTNQSFLLSSMSDLTGPFALADASELVSLNGLFSLTMIAKITHGSTPSLFGTIVSSFDAEIEALPEPSGAAVWAGVGGFAGLGLVAQRWHRRKPLRC